MKEFRILVAVVIYALTVSDVIVGVRGRFRNSRRGKEIEELSPFLFARTGLIPLLFIVFPGSEEKNTKKRRKLSLKQGLSELESVPLSEKLNVPCTQDDDQSTSTSEEVPDLCKNKRNRKRTGVIGGRKVWKEPRHLTSDFLNTRSLHIPRRFMVKTRGRKSSSHGDDKGGRSLSGWGIPRMLTGGKVFRRRK
ncbi:hypothetical protein GE061_005535 [Apolygus lucorum]|uniref:Uncharacterized protein n=1 Tax=Apolygus lucorum TaxID=248454 RepID=A0A6A4IUV5_APOLU|nr:hypothetical protein GE061_005535 [Apolygus lucorum]